MSEPMIGSSPLKTATSVSGALSAYLSKYCEVATGNRVILQGMNSYGSGHWFRFKCQTCQDNWNVKTDLFTDAAPCPTELTDWVEKHRHVCQDFSIVSSTSTSMPTPNPRCSGCGWPWTQHKAAQPVFDIETGVWTVKDVPTAKPLPAAAGGQTGSFLYHKLPDGNVISINTGTSEITRGKTMPTKIGPGKIIDINSGKTFIIPYQMRTTGVRPCVVCQEVIPVASGSSVCDECYEAAKKVHETKKLTMTATQGRMFRTKVTEEG